MYSTAPPQFILGIGPQTHITPLISLGNISHSGIYLVIKDRRRNPSVLVTVYVYAQRRWTLQRYITLSTYQMKTCIYPPLPPYYWHPTYSYSIIFSLSLPSPILISITLSYFYYSNNLSTLHTLSLPSPEKNRHPASLFLLLLNNQNTLYVLLTH